MKTVEEFERFYDQELRESLMPMEHFRKQYVKWLRLLFLVLFAGIGGAFYLYALSYSTGAIILGIAVIATLIVIGVKLSSVRSKIRQSFKEQIIHKIVAFVDPNLKYDHKRCISQSTFQDSGIFQSRIARYKGDDLVEGVLDKTDVSFSEIHAENYRKDKDGKKTYYTVFRGLFFTADFHKEFKGKTYVLTDFAERFMGGVGKMLQRNNFTRPDLVKMENPVFEKQFVVYGSDQVEARYIITPVMMETMLEINNMFKRVQFSFVDSRIYIAIPMRKALFEPRYLSPITQIDYLRDYYKLLFSCVSLVEMLDLNTRIWSKD